MITITLGSMPACWLLGRRGGGSSTAGELTRAITWAPRPAQATISIPQHMRNQSE
jgi:hypothetical protein